VTILRYRKRGSIQPIELIIQRSEYQLEAEIILENHKIFLTENRVLIDT
jgi:hypothetical protein